jgi:hypothetical protein
MWFHNNHWGMHYFRNKNFGTKFMDFWVRIVVAAVVQEVVKKLFK